MIHHPVLLGLKTLFLIILIVVLVILHGHLTPEQFRIALIIAAVLFVCFTLALWIAAFKLLNNPESKMAKQMVLQQEARAEDGFQASADQYADLIGDRGVALSALRPAGVALVQGKRVSVVTDGEFIPPGGSVEVVEAKGSRVVVRAVTGSADEKQNGD
jgi:membrane-bound serine protease (ClpP class)